MSHSFISLARDDVFGDRLHDGPQCPELPLGVADGPPRLFEPFEHVHERAGHLQRLEAPVLHVQRPVGRDPLRQRAHVSAQLFRLVQQLLRHVGEAPCLLVQLRHRFIPRFGWHLRG